MRTRISLQSYITEAKFKGLSSDELQVCNDELAEFKKNENIVSKFSETKVTNPEYGNKYYVKMKNPFADPHKFSKTFNGTKQYSEPVETEDYIECIGIADKFGRIFLQNVWETDKPAYIEYKKAERKTSKSGYKYVTKEGWYMTRKEIDVYNVKPWYSGKRGEGPLYFTDENISHGVWAKYINDDVIYVIDLSKIPVEIERISKKIADDKKAEEKRKKAEENDKKFWDDRKDYVNYGIANSWGDDIPDPVKKALADKSAKWFTVDLNPSGTYREEWCDTYKLYYSVDSSD